MRKMVYLDHNATTPVHPEVFKAIRPYLKDKYGNASSIYGKGREARAAVEEAREVIGDFLGTESVDIIFTSGGTEADNFAVKGTAWRNRDRGNHIITSSVEHPAVLECCASLEKTGFSVTYLPADKFGMVAPEDLKKAITGNTILVSIMHANNEVGTIQPITEFVRITRKKGIPFHTDAVQAFGKIPVNVEELGVDMLSVSAHKLYGPKGIGCLYVRKGTKLYPHQHGGHHERRMRAGTENVPGIVGFGKAVELLKGDYLRKSERVRELRDRLHQGFMDNLDHVHLNGHPEKRLPGTVNVSFEYIEGESIILNLDLKGICASTGSACTSGSLEPSHVLTAMKVPTAVAQGSIRFSPGNDNTAEQIDYVVKQTVSIVRRLRKMSPLA